MAFKRAVLIMFAAYIAVCAYLFGPSVMDVLEANDRLGHLPVGRGKTVDERNTLVRVHVRSTVRVGIVGYDEQRGLGEGYGTGALIDADGLILTAAHVAEGKEFLHVSFRRLDATGTGLDELRDEPADVLAVSTERDQAIIRLRHPERVRFTPLPVRADAKLPKGKAFWFIGTTSMPNKVVIAGTDEDQILGDLGDAIRAVSVKGVVDVVTHARPGDSGGPVLDDQGRIVAVMIGSDGDRKGVITPLHNGFTELYAKAKERAAELDAEKK
jgi:serine protease Do